MRNGLPRRKNPLAQAGYDEAIRWSLLLLYNTSESHQRIAIAASSMWKKTLAERSYRTRRKTMLIPCIRITSTPLRYAWIADHDDAANSSQLLSAPGSAL
ncbi:hypothetical protein LNP74_25090 [Klebsiella pneumoniae subsp. pneumoniae]|nr:hypothetical protein [Klebsiella pneumoniae subsp. pneumoniae]